MADNSNVQLIALVKIIYPGNSNATKQIHELKMVSTGDTVEQLKIKIEEEFGYKASHQQLCYCNDIMDNEERLLHYKVENNTFNYVEIYVYMMAGRVQGPPPQAGGGFCTPVWRPP